MPVSRVRNIRCYTRVLNLLDAWQRAAAAAVKPEATPANGARAALAKATAEASLDVLCDGWFSKAVAVLHTAAHDQGGGAQPAPKDVNVHDQANGTHAAPKDASTHAESSGAHPAPKDAGAHDPGSSSHGAPNETNRGASKGQTPKK